jgi:hypothetical protein
MICVRGYKNPNHVLVKPLSSKGYTEIFLIFAPRFSVDYGWTLDCEGGPNGNGFNNWIGFTKKEALEFIKKHL